jgi:hypothetical protein
MNLSRISLYIIVLILFSTAAFAFDRAAIHERDLGHLMLSGRQQLNPTLAGKAAQVTLGTDWTISESVSPARFRQENVAVTTTGNKGWIVAWNDDRFGNENIFLRRLDSLGVETGEETMIPAVFSGIDVIDPRLAVDAQGRIFLFYRDATDGLLFGSRFDSNLVVDIEPFLVNDTSFDTFVGLYDIAVFPNGRSVVVWENYSAIASTVEMKIYDSDSAVALDSSTVTSGGGLTPPIAPLVTVNPAGYFLVAWEDYRNANQPDIYVQLYDQAGFALGGNTNIIDVAASAADQYAPEAAFSAVDQFLVGWIDQRDGQQVFVQRYHVDSSLIGANLNLSGTDPDIITWDLNLAVSPQGRFMANWAAFGAQNNIMRLHIDSGLVISESPTVVNSAVVGQRWAPAASWNDNYRYAVTWEELFDSDPDINFQLFDSTDNALLAGEIQLNTDTVGAPSEDPAAAASISATALVVFSDKRFDAGDVFVQAIDISGDMSTGNVKLNQDAAGNLQAQPSIAISPNKALAIWFDTRTINLVPGRRVFGRFGTPTGSFTENEFLISDTVQGSVFATPRVVMNRQDRALVAWIDDRLSGDSLQVIARWLDASGQPETTEFPVSDITGDFREIDLHLSVDSLDRFYVVWRGVGLDTGAVNVKWYADDLSDSGSFSWMSPYDSVIVDEVVAAVGDSGNVTLLWTGIDALATKLYMTILNHDGSIEVPSFEITDDPLALPSEPVLATGDHGWRIAAWIDRRQGQSSLYYQVYLQDLSPVGNNLAVSTATPEFMTSPAIAATVGRAWFTWVDPRENGLNVYAANLVYLPVGVGDDPAGSLPASVALNQNYPNPFNAATRLAFTLQSRQAVNVAVYNVLGRKVKVLADGEFPAGEHWLTWDGTDELGRNVASGVYLYRLKAASASQSRKMMLLK